MLKRFLSYTLLPLSLTACTAGSSNAVASTPKPEAAGVVSAADPRAAEAGAEILRKGGSATDAAIATMLVLGVVEPQSSGIGGGGFLMYGDKDGGVATFDGREAAPMAAGPDWLMKDGKPRPFMEAVLSGLSVGVPGNIRLAAKAHERTGNLPWKDLFAPAIRQAESGFTISGRLHEFLVNAKNRAAATPEGQALFYDASGAPLTAGTVVKNPAMAATLKAVAERGPDFFYTGDNALAIANKVSAATPGPRGMVTGDIEHYAAKERAPVCGTYRAYKICGMGPPSSGATTVLAILKQIEGFDMSALGSNSPVAWHLFAESQRLAFADRELYLADEDFLQVPVAGLVDPAYLKKRGELISASSTMASAPAGRPFTGDAPPIAWADGDEPEENGTSHFVAVDQWGNSVSYTSTVEGSFGSGIMVGGYYLNNELTDFSFSPEADGRPVANRVEPGKRPRSSMAPTLVYDAQGKLVLAIGAAGGATIPVQVTKALIGWIDWRLSAQDAIALPMLFSPGDTITVEQGSALVAMIPALEALGHKGIGQRGLPLKANAVERTPQGWVGAADPRSEGTAVRQ